MTEKIDNQIDELLKKIEEKKAEIEKDKKLVSANWKTSTKINYGGREINLKVAKVEDIKNLVLYLIRTKQDEESVASLLEIDAVNQINGYSFDDWITDCKKRVKTISLDEKIKSLEKNSKIVESFYSEDKRREKQFEKIKEELPIQVN
jgi:hypothetical protein